MKRLLIALLCGAPAILFSQPQAPPSASGSGAPAEPPKLTAEQTASIMKQLDEIEGKFTKSRGDLLGIALARCKSASAGEKEALELYIACYKMEHFDKLNLKQTDFQEWKQRNEDRFKDPHFLYTNWLVVDFLKFSIQAQDAKDLGPLVTALQDYIPRAVAGVQATLKHTTSGAVKENDKGKKPPTRGGQGGGGRSFGSNQVQNVLTDSVQDSEFSKAFQLKDFLTRADWEYNPLAIGGIYDKVIFPYYLEKKPAELPAQWDARIKNQLVLRQATLTDAEYGEYYKDHYPVLLWLKARYLFDHNVNAIGAMADMLKIVRENPAHPRVGEWVKELRNLVINAQPGGPPSSGVKLDTTVGDAATDTSK